MEIKQVETFLIMNIKKQSHKITYNPGSLPTRPAPAFGEEIQLEVAGWPPWKDPSASIRNPSHQIHDRYAQLRTAATEEMDGRASYRGPIQLDITIYGPSNERENSLTDYLGGIQDSLDGSHGPNFTYLPICYEDDCQICSVNNKFVDAPNPRYTIFVYFM